ncbi:uncharacterized protein LOC119666053 [Teleopsis dalmanni]|uniref:uncharacterized protein LOC119666053 n=1 Tax=Teleopsis dalmanni TaxID=139649 RepID=UPI0018CC972A|nr:uncharacterized protein LOC119666053 [Teleopsis dalmanni]
MKNLRESLSELITKQLQELLRKYGLPHWYNLKVNLIDRLEKFMENSEKNWKSELKNNEITLNTEEKLVNANNNNTIKSDAADGETLNMSSEQVQNNINFKEVEESLELFDGESNKKIEDWLLDFESISVVCKWNQVQRFLYCKRLLRGAAKLAVEAETGVNSWEILKRTLRTEFRCQELENLHKKLENMKKRSNESFLEYFYKMKKVASRGTVEETHLIEYIIARIPDSSLNKATLYQSCTLEQLKINLKAYEKFKADQEKKKRCQGRNNYDNYYSGNQVNKRCNNCGAVSHTTQHCPNRGRGRRYFKCNEFGHIATICQNNTNFRRPVSQQNPNQARSSASRIDRVQLSDFTLKIQILEQSFEALVDTGSDINIITQRATECLGVEGFNGPVPDSWVNTDVILGKGFLRCATVLIDKGEIITYKNKTRDDVEAGSHINLICISDVTDAEDLSNIKNSLLRADPRRLAQTERDFVQFQIQEWLENGIIQESSSNYASPIVLARKKDGSYRLCVDYRKLNSKVIRDRHPLPNYEEILEGLYNATVFTTLDLCNGFFHVNVDELSMKYTSFVIPDGQYEFRKVPFGLCNSPAAFQRYINTIFQNLIKRKIVLVYMNDLIIPADDEEDGVRKLKEVLFVAENHGLLIKWEKCAFLRKSVEFLGHLVEHGEIRPSEEKIRAVKKFPTPKNLHGVMSFLGLTGFFRKFIKGYALVAKPLTDLTKKHESFVWGEIQNNAFVLLKESLCCDPVLKLFNPTLPTQLHTDASKEGYGAVLLQKHGNKNYHPVFYLSYKTKAAEKNYCSYDLEVLAIVIALKKLRIYLLGMSFEIFTDYKAFQQTMDKNTLNSRVSNWAMQLEEFYCKVSHRSGSSMRHVDALSRYLVVLQVEDGIVLTVKKA